MTKDKDNDTDTDKGTEKELGLGLGLSIGNELGTTISKQEKNQLIHIMSYKSVLVKYIHTDREKFNRLSHKVDEWLRKLVREHTKQDVAKFRKVRYKSKSKRGNS